jgi:hypothetical protein
MRYLVSGSGGAGFDSPAEAKELLGSVVHPSFEALIQLESQGKVLGGGLPVGDRSVVFILEAASHEEADIIIQGLPIWSMLEWQVIPLQTIAGRLEQEKALLSQMGA